MAKGQVWQANVSGTIFAVATGRGTAGIGVIRISGPEADAALGALIRGSLPAERCAALRTLRDASGEILDRALLLRFGEGASFTGEATVELHCHGGIAVLRSVMDRLGELPGLRPAEPGEFTRRAFEAGRMDLLEVEALGDLIAAETDLQRRRALRGGDLVRKAEGWREALVQALALVEVTIDWADEEVPENVAPEVRALLADLRAGMAAELAGSARAERLRQGLEVAIVGAPNAGKSTLFNALAGREAALTAATPGTTRDVLELRYDLAGLPVIFLDTAGLRDGGDEVETAGIARARERAAAAELRIFLASADAPLPEAEAALWREGDVLAWSKADLRAGPGDVAVAAKAGTGIADLLDLVGTRLEGMAGEASLLGHARQRHALASAEAPLVEAWNQVEVGATELAADSLRRAIRALDAMIGRVGTEDVLDQVFARFCLGK